MIKTWLKIISITTIVILTGCEPQERDINFQGGGRSNDTEQTDEKD